MAFALGFGISAWGDRFLPAFSSNDLPLPVVAALIAAVVYLALAMPLRERLLEGSGERHRSLA